MTSGEMHDIQVLVVLSNKEQNAQRQPIIKRPSTCTTQPFQYHLQIEMDVTRSYAELGFGTGVAKLFEHGSDRRETLPKRVSDDSERFVL